MPKKEIATLQPHQKRVVSEHSELNVKIEKLFGFIRSAQFESVPPEERNRLRKQHIVMLKYSAILEERIDAF